MSNRRSLSPRREQGSDQRFLTFSLLAVAIFLFSQSLFRPPAPPAKDPAAEQAGDAGAGAAGALAAGPEGGKPAGAGGDAASLNAANLDAANRAAADDETPAIEAAPAVEPQLVSLGSAEVDGPYRMLLTLDNQGAGVQRAELSTHEFRDLDDRGGYLGELALGPVETGLEVRAVGAGTPAELAGIRVGDVITDAEAFQQALAEAKPGQPFEVTLQRVDETMTRSGTYIRRPLAVMRPESENVRLHNPEMAADVPDVLSFLVSISSVDGRGASDPAVAAANRELKGGAWEVVEADGETALFRKRLPGLGLEFEKRFTLVETPEAERENPKFPSYHFAFDVRVRNLLPTPQAVAYVIDGPNGLPIEGWWYANRIGFNESGNGSWGMVGLRDVVARYAGNKIVSYRCNTIVEGDAKPMGQAASMAYLGVDAQYFSVVMIPEKQTLAERWFDVAEARLATPELPKDGTLPSYNNTTFTATRSAVPLAAAGAEGAEHGDAFRVFAGPKRPDLLAEYVPGGDPDYSLHNLLYYGWFGWVARPMLGLLHLFYAIVGNYGLAIIMLTICVRGAMFPLSRKQAQNMMKMQTLKPEMDRITEKYKDDMEKRSRAQQELFAKHGVNPLGGCLPMFVQLPIFIGLYRALAVDIELRQAPLVSESVRFCSNLAAPDQLFDWSAWMPQWWNNGQSFGLFPGLGPYFNLLPIITIVLFLLQQKMFMPEATNEQARLQQKLMKYMMVVFGLMFFKVPSGLCLYFVASSLWGITERKLLPKPPAPATSEAGFSKPAASGGGSAKNAAKKRPPQGSSGAKKKKKKRK